MHASLSPHPRMVRLLLFSTVVFLLDASVETYTVPQDDAVAFSSSNSRLIYATSESNPAFSGYSYATQDLNGGRSNVVFTTGAGSVSRSKGGINLIHKDVDGADMPDGHSQDALNEIPQTQTSPGFTYEKDETNPTRREKLESSVEILSDGETSPTSSEVNDNLVEYQVPLEQVSLVPVPYSSLRSSLLNLQLPTVHIEYPTLTNRIAGQYYSDDHYADLELPLQDFDFYDHAVPLFYQAAITIPDGSFRLVPAASEDGNVFREPSVTKDSQINAAESSSSKSNAAKLRSDVETTRNIPEGTSSNESLSTNEFQSMKTMSERAKEEITSHANSTETAKASVRESEIKEKQIETNSTEPANTETPSLRQKPSTNVHNWNVHP